MELDETGFPQPTGEVEELEADSLVLALGQESDLTLLERTEGVEIDDGVASVGPGPDDRPRGLFAGGDIVPAERTVTAAVGHGRTAARAIDCYLRGERGARAAGQDRDRRRTELVVLRRCAAHGAADARGRASRVDLRRGHRWPRHETALFEARRCLSCGSCFACDNCYGVCPDNAALKLEPGGAYAYAFDLDYCKGCGLCMQECPGGAIEMEPEPI